MPLLLCLDGTRGDIPALPDTAHMHAASQARLPRASALGTGRGGEERLSGQMRPADELERMNQARPRAVLESPGDVGPA